MPESSNQAPQRHRRANWVALRTLRQRPRVAGETADGEIVFEVRDVRLVLRGESQHFTRLVQCSKCGREVPGAPVLGPEDLDRAPSPVICRECVRQSGMTAVRPASDRRSAPPAPPAPPAEAPPPPAPDRIDAIDDQLRVVMDRLTELHAGAGPKAEDLLAELRAEMAASAAATEASLGELDRRVQEGMASVVQAVETQRAQLDALATSVVDAQREIGRVGEVQAQLANAHAALDRRLSEVTAGVPPAVDVQRRLDEIRAELLSILDTRGAVLRQALASDLGEARNLAVERDGELQHAVSGLSAMVASLRSDLDGAAASTMGDELASVTKAHEELGALLDRVDGRMAALEQKVEAVAASVDAEDGRVLEIEQRMYEGLNRIGARMAAPQAPGGGLAMSLLDTLEEQLAAADRRLAATSGGQRPGREQPENN